MTEMTKMTAKGKGGGSGPQSVGAPSTSPLSLMSPMSFEKGGNVFSRWYEKPSIQDALLSQCSMRELAIRNGTSFIRNLVARNREELSRLLYGARSVFAGVEKYEDPSKPARRIGWDFVVDLDGKDWNETKWIAAQLFRDIILPQFNIKHYRLKFSGRRGIHVVIPEEAFLFYFRPQDFADAYLSIPIEIAKFFDAMIYPESKKLCKIDMGLYIHTRLLRCAYALHDESGLVSVPIWPEDLDRFDPKKDADPASVEVDENWLKIQPTPGEASFLLDKVSEWVKSRQENRQPPQVPYHQVRSKPGRIMPCVKNLLDQGFKASMEGSRNLVLFNTIQAVKRFNLPITSEELFEANAKSACPLPTREVKATLRYHFEKRGENAYFFKTEIMRDVGLCPPEGCWLCRRSR
jgi:hypothetical protein